jgi:predicted methyltransferase
MKDIHTSVVSLPLNYNLKKCLGLGYLALAAPKRGQSNKYEHFFIKDY